MDELGFEPPTISGIGLEENLEWNRQRWGQRAGWVDKDSYGYNWGGNFEQDPGRMAQLADTFLRPFLPARWDLVVLEISPGAGRFTAELIRLSKHFVGVDINQAAIDICRERFKYYPGEITWHRNDGRTLACVERNDFDLIASYDSMVHMHPEVVASYINESARLLGRGGLLWIDHSGRGVQEQAHRTDVTAELARESGRAAGLAPVAQIWRNDWDCISVFRKPETGPAAGGLSPEEIRRTRESGLGCR